ncbi:MAG: TonB family protein [Cyclobacteriaceae bacterium]|nr:TonB family protein [Cyclobacteriaceae bacterium]
MTRQEALEYLNLPANSSDQLVRRRYLELHRDYQKAITNAPSDHFRALYRENLDKIEEAYLLMKSTMSAEVSSDDTPISTEEQVQKSIKDAQVLINTFMGDKSGQTQLDQASQSQILHYIDQISSLQEFLKEEQVKQDPAEPSATEKLVLTAALSATPLPEQESSNTSEPPETPPKPTVEAPASGPPPVITDSPEATPPEATPDVESENQNIKINPTSTFGTAAQPSTNKSSSWFNENNLEERSKSFNRLVMGSIFVVFLGGIGGLFYMVYPVIFPPPQDAEPTILAEAPQKSIPHIVGDEFFRTGNILEALVQYTLALAEDPENGYLLQQVDSCKSLLTTQQAGLSGLSPAESQPLSPETTPPNRFTPTENSQANSANRFRGDEPTASDDINWSESGGDSENINQQLEDSGQSALVQDVANPVQIDSSLLLGPKTSGTIIPVIDENKIYSIVEEKPEPIGGYEKFARFTARRIKYPADAYKNRVSGIVIVQFIVHRDGSTSGAKVVKGIGYGCDEEALRVVKLFSGWMPGKINSTIVNTKVAVPIIFKLAH